MFHLAGGIAFGVDILNFLQLQRPFQGHRIVNAASQEKKILRAHEFARQFLALFLPGEQGL